MERQFPTVDQALETSAGLALPWGRIESMVVRGDAEDDHALVVIDLFVDDPEVPRTGRSDVTAQRLGRWSAAATTALMVAGLGTEHWGLAVLASAAAGVAGSRVASAYGFADEDTAGVAAERTRCVGVAVGINTRSFEPSAFHGDVERFEDVVAEINVAAEFTECRDASLARAWEAACLDNSPTRCPTDDPDDWWAYWLAYREVTRQNRRNTV